MSDNLSKLETSLLAQRKLILLMDLDHTLLHCTCRKIKRTPGSERERFYSLASQENRMFSVRLRPHVEDFLREMAPLFMMVVCTAATRVYAMDAIKVLDLYEDKIENQFYCLEDYDSDNKTNALVKLFGRKSSPLTIIIDDLADQWPGIPNLIHVKKIHLLHGFLVYKIWWNCISR